MMPRDEVQRIIGEVAQRHGLLAGDLTGRSRVRPIVVARYEAMRAVKAAFPHFSTPRIGRIFNRDHAVVVRAFGGVTYSDPRKQRALDRINCKLGGAVPAGLRHRLGGGNQRAGAGGP